MGLDPSFRSRTPWFLLRHSFQPGGSAYGGAGVQGYLVLISPNNYMNFVLLDSHVFHVGT